VKKLVGRTDIEDAMKKLDTLTQEEALMASAEALKVVRSVDNKMDTVIDGVQHVSGHSPLVILNIHNFRCKSSESRDTTDRE
jgi:hypothetical protein